MSSLENNYWPRTSRRLSRRTLLGAIAASGAGIAVAACGGNTAKNTSSNSKRSSSPTRVAASSVPAVVGTGTAPVATSAAVPTSATAPAAGSFKTGGTIQLSFVVSAPLDPYENATYSCQEVAGFTYSRLFRFSSGPSASIGESHQPVPDVVDSYEITPDKLTYTMRLRQGVMWHPPLNRPLTTADVLASWQRFTTDPKNLNSHQFNPIVDSLTAPDNQTLVFKLKTPYVPFLNIMANPQYFWIMPKEATNGKIDPATQMVGTGPWIFVSKSPTAFTYKKNPDYFIKGIPYADGVVLNVIPSTATVEAQFQAGRLASIGVPTQDLANVRKAVAGATLASSDPTAYYWVFFDHVQNPSSAFHDVRMRQAVSMAIDRKGLIDLAFDGKGTWSNIIPAGLGKWWLDPQGKDIGDPGKSFQHNPAQAKQLLTAAGHADTPFKFLYPNNAYGDTFNSASDAVRGMLTEAGFKLQVVTVDYLKDWINNGQGYFWHGVPANSIGHGIQSPFTDPDDYLSNILAPGGNRNSESINDPALNTVIKQQQQEFDQTKRLQLVYQAQKLADAQMYYVPTVIGTSFVLSQPWAKNYFPVGNYAYGTESVAYLSVNNKS